VCLAATYHAHPNEDLEGPQPNRLSTIIGRVIFSLDCLAIKAFVSLCLELEEFANEWIVGMPRRECHRSANDLAGRPHHMNHRLLASKFFRARLNA
jgi:hypothetical protein